MLPDLSITFVENYTVAEYFYKIIISDIPNCQGSLGMHLYKTNSNFRSSRPEVFFRKGVLKICSKFTGEHTWRSVISTKL